MALLTHPDWKSLIQSAEARSAITLPSSLENYLTDLLKRFAKDPEMTQHAMAVAWLLAEQAKEAERYVRVGDECLILAGLFPQYVTRRALNLRYYVQLGQTAYAAISHQATDIYGVLSTQFVVLMDVLYYVRAETPELLPYDAYERFRSTGSDHAKRILANYESITPIRRPF